MSPRIGSAVVSTIACAVLGTTAANASAATTVALWHMDETSGTVMRDAVRNHSGTLRRVTLGLPGFLGTAYGFTTSDVTVPSANDLNPGSANLTVTLRMKTTKKPSTPDWDLIRKGQYTTSGGEFKMEYQPTGQASCGFKGSKAYSELIAGPSIKDNRWHTVQCVKTSSAIQLVVDGRVFSKAAVIGNIGNSAPVIIGSYPGAEYFKGALDEASIAIG